MKFAHYRGAKHAYQTVLCASLAIPGKLEGVLGPRPPLLSTDAVADFDLRLHQLPVRRVHHWAGYWALRSVEHAYERRLARQWQLTEEQRREVDEWWLMLVGKQVDKPLETLRERAADRRRRGMPRTQNRVAFQLLFNTVGPGGRPWFGNRYTTFRRLTFRLRWRA